jgi:predicted ATPase
MITYIKIKGFKSFDNFEMEFSPFTVIAGANASGKSNLFDVLMLLSRLADPNFDFQRAFSEAPNQRGEMIELFTKYTKNHQSEYASEMSFVVEMLIDKNITDKWGRSAELKHTRLRYELNLKRITNERGFDEIILDNEVLDAIKVKNDEWINNHILAEQQSAWRPKQKTGRNIPYIYTEHEKNVSTVFMPQDGTTGNKRRFPLNNKATQTVLSSVDSIDFPHTFAVREEMRSWRFLQLNPDDLRKPTKKQGGIDTLSPSGKNLAGVLYRIKQEDDYNLVAISRKIQKLLPNFIEVDVTENIESKEYVIKLIDIDKQEYSSRVLSEGTLRLLALCVMEYDEKHTGLLCFEEPENGIHPFRMATIVAQIKSLCVNFSDIDSPLRQVIINTHSPVFISALYDYLISPEVSLWYVKMVSRIGQGIKMVVTMPNKLDIANKNGQINLDIGKLTLNTIIQYLETVDSEQFKNAK